MLPSKAPSPQAAFLEPLAALAGTEIVAAEFLLQQLVAVDDSQSPFDLRLGRESPPAFAHRLKRNTVGRSCVLPWVTLLSRIAGSSRPASVLARNRTWSTSIASSRANPAHSKDSFKLTASTKRRSVNHGRGYPKGVEPLLPASQTGVPTAYTTDTICQGEAASCRPSGRHGI